jgi:hypothetical protein
MRRLSRDLIESLDESGVVEHALTKGEVREEEVREAFRPHIPRRYDLSSGIVTNASGEQSKQQDLIVSDNDICPPFFRKGGIGFHPVETVCATVEVKSEATPTEVTRAVQNAASVARLVATGPESFPMQFTPEGLVMQPTAGPSPITPFSGVICLKPAANPDSVCEAYREANRALQPHERTSCLLLLGELLVVWGDDSGPITHPVEGASLLAVRYAEDALMMFYAGLLTALSNYQRPPFSLNEYLRAARKPISLRRLAGPPLPEPDKPGSSQG